MFEGNQVINCKLKLIYISSFKERDAGDWGACEPQQAAEPPQVHAGQLQSSQGQDVYEFF
jgi:hypothetical protein